MQPLLELDNVTKVYPAPQGLVRALDKVSLGLQAGEFVAVRGVSGCGKTTLLLTAGTLLQPGSGTVRVSGQDPYALAPEARARFRAGSVGFVFQQFHLVPYLSVLENVLTPALAQPSRDAPERAKGLLRELGLEPRLGHKPGALSTGERQRVALARALLNRPRLLLADEPTGNLDEANAARVLDHLAGFAQAGGAVLLATHDSKAASRAGRILAMEAGLIKNHSPPTP
jgi:putative ABC transport system ATP-binding protein